VKATGKKMFIHGGRHRGSTRPENLRRSRSEISEFYTLTSRDFGSGAPPLTPIGKYLSVPFFSAASEHTGGSRVSPRRPACCILHCFFFNRDALHCFFFINIFLIDTLTEFRRDNYHFSNESEFLAVPDVTLSLAVI
jgi:hypothetical protein